MNTYRFRTLKETINKTERENLTDGLQQCGVYVSIFSEVIISPQATILCTYSKSQELQVKLNLSIYLHPSLKNSNSVKIAQTSELY